MRQRCVRSCSHNKCSIRRSYCKIRYLVTIASATVVTTMIMRAIKIVVCWTVWIRSIGWAWCRVNRVCWSTIGNVDDIPLTTTRIVTNHVSSTRRCTDAEDDYDCKNHVLHFSSPVVSVASTPCLGVRPSTALLSGEPKLPASAIVRLPSSKFSVLVCQQWQKVTHYLQLV